MKAVRSEFAGPADNPLCELRGDSHDSAGMIHPVSAIVRWAWRHINFCRLTPGGFNPEEDGGSCGNFAGARCAAGSRVVDSNERAFAKREAPDLPPLVGLRRLSRKLSE
jgi:hypothetical protein